MKDLHISPTFQLIAGIVIVGGAGAIVASQLPEIRRYLSMRSM